MKHDAVSDISKYQTHDTSHVASCDGKSFLSTVVTNASQYGKGGGLVASGAGLATITAAPKGSGVAEHGNLFDGRSSFPTPNRTENILCLRACLRGGASPRRAPCFRIHHSEVDLDGVVSLSV